MDILDNAIKKHEINFGSHPDYIYVSLDIFRELHNMVSSLRLIKYPGIHEIQYNCCFVKPLPKLGKYKVYCLNENENIDKILHDEEFNNKYLEIIE